MSTDYGGGGSSGAQLLPDVGPPPDTHHPLIDFGHGLSKFVGSLGSADAHFISTVAGLPAQAAMGVPRLLGSAGTELSHLRMHSVGGAMGAPVVDITAKNQEQFNKEHPLSSGLAHGLMDTASDVEQVPRAGLNTIGQIPRLAGLKGYEPGGASVGELGTGAGLLGKTDLAKAATRGGGGVAPRLLNDLANIAIVTGPLSEALGASAKGAAEEASLRGGELSDLQSAQKEATSATADAEKNYQKAIEQLQPAHVAAQTGDPVAAAQWVQTKQAADAAGESLRQAREFEATHGPGIDAAQSVADDAQSRADRLAKIAKVGKIVHNLGSTAANSPFEALHGFGLANKILETEGAQRLVGPETAVGKYVTGVADRARETGVYKHLTREGEMQFAGEAAHMRRGGEETAAQTSEVPDVPRRSLLHPLKGGRGALGMTQDVDRQAVATMAQTGEFNLLRHYAVDRPLPGGDGELVDRFLRLTERRDGTPQYTPEQVHLAIEAARESTDRGAELAKQLEGTREAYSKEGGLGEQQATNYAALRGEHEPVVKGSPPGAGAFGQVAHNLEGEGPSIEHLDEFRRGLAKYESDVNKHTGRAAKSAKKLESASRRLGGLGLSEEEMRNPRALLDRMMTPAREVAREALDPKRIAELTGENVESRVRRIAQRVVDGKLDPNLAVRDLATEIIRSGARNSLSDPLRALVDDATERGMGIVPKGIGNIASHMRGAELVGGARERLRAGTVEYDRAVRDLARGGDTLGRANEKLREPNRPPSQRQIAASKRLVDAGNRLRELQDRVAKQPELEAGAAAESTQAEARAAVSEIRNAAKAWHREQAKAIDDELAEAGVKGVNPTPPAKPRAGYAKNRGGNARAGQRIVSNVPDWSNGGWDFADHLFREMDPKLKAWGARNGYFELGEGRGLSPEQAVEQWGSAHLGGQDMRDDPAGTMEAWLSKVEDAYEHSKSGRTAVAKAAGSDEAIDSALQRTGWSAGGDDPLHAQLAEAVGHGTLEEAVPRVLDVFRRMDERQAADTAPTSRLQPGGDVHTALEADRTNAEQRGIHDTGALQAREQLDEPGKALYDRQVLEDQAQIQGEHIVPQREAQLENAPSPGRRQGVAEGKLLGRAGEQINQGELAATRGDAAQQQGRALLGQASELTQRAAGNLATPIAEMYSRVGSAKRDFATASAEYAKQTRALERLDEKWAAKRDDLMQSVAAQPRAWRPVAELAQRFNADFGTAADEADLAYGEGAGDVYRVAAADAANSVMLLKQSGFDPQFLIGLREGKTPEAFTPTVTSKLSGRPGQLPVARITGQRAPGIGLAHETTYKGVTGQAIDRLHQIVKNATAQKIMDTLGGSLHDMLVQRGMDSADLQKMDQQQLVRAMHDGKLSAWNASDWRGRLTPGKEVDLNTPVIPQHIWREYAPTVRESDNKFLHAYDTALRHWKAADLYLTGRWHTNLLLGHAVMSMVGTGTDPINYFRNVQIATRLERLRLGLGTVEDRAFVEEHATPAQARALALSKGYTPGAVVDRGYSESEFGGGERDLENTGFMARHAPGNVHPIQAGWRFQSHIDNLNRTATWLGLLDKGLDESGLADFRKAYPEMAHLTNDEIKNEAAIRLSIRTIGDYKNLSHFEQSTVKRIIPFYGWMRHVTKLALNLSIHNPVRVAWMLHLGLMYSPQSSGVDWLDSAYDRGGNRWYTPPHWDPFDSLAHTTDADNPFGSISPLINLPVEAATGFNLQRGKPVSRPWSTPDGPLGLKSDVYAAGSSVPLFAALRTSVPALLGHAPIARYASGDPVLSGHQLVAPDQQQVPFLNLPIPNAVGPLTPLLGLGGQQVIDSQAIKDAQDRKALATRKARATWEKELRAAKAAAG